MAKKHARRNKPLRDKARRLVRLWYDDRCERNEARYRAVSARPVLMQGQTSTHEALPEQPWNKPLTANGKETRQPPSSRPLVHAMNVDAYGEFRINPDLRFVSHAMGRIAKIQQDSHKALEMDAASYDIEGIAEELKCGERLARDYLGDGLAMLMLLISLRNELGW